jgi:hypothetical protein
MSRRLRRDLAVGLAIALVAFGGVYWQAGQAGASGEVPHLICPLH